MKKIVLISILMFPFFNANAQTLIGTKENFKPYKSYLKAPNFLEILEKANNPKKTQWKLLRSMDFP